MASSDRKTRNHSPSSSNRGQELDTLLWVERSRLAQNQSLPAPHTGRSSQRRRLIGITLVVIALTGYPLYFLGSQLAPVIPGISCVAAPVKTATAPGQRSIALIDQLSNTYPNPGFVENVSATASKAGFGFAYYPAGVGTMNFFVNLPGQGFSMIILRTHGTGLNATDPSTIVTSESYSDSQHVADQLTGRVTSADVNGTRYFALDPSFVSEDMCGRFSGTLILAMFCGGYQPPLADAFIKKGASAYVGWNNGVYISRTDLAFKLLVKQLVDGSPVNQSIQDVMSVLGPDPIYTAQLMSYS